jgi:Ca-activated chloride channel family protein
MKVIKPLVLAHLLLFVTLCGAQERDFSDQNEAPYFAVLNEGFSTEDFPLLATNVHATILGPVADVVVKQTYKNEGQVPIEATYVFPASTRAAVYEMSMLIGDRTIKAEIQEKNEAVKNYQQAKESGKRASLLSQERANVFKMQVANIMPGDLVQVVMRYNEFIIPENQIYSFVYPTVVGPRYVSDQNQGANAAFVSNPYLKEGRLNPAIFDISLDIALDIPLKALSCNTHKIEAEFKDKKRAMITLSSDAVNGGNRDFILNYQVSDAEVVSGTILYEHADEKFFLTTIEPPLNPKGVKILPREYIFVIDVSGSMSGFPISTTKALMKDLFATLSENDFFNVLLFAGDNAVLSDFSLTASRENLAKAFNLIDQLQGGGGTELLPALERIQTIPKQCVESSRSIVIVTDGYISVEPEVFDLIARTLSDANVFAFGIGSGVNRLLIEGMAHIGRGEAFIVTKPEFAHIAAKRFRKYIDRPLLSNIQIAFENFDAYDVVPASIPDLMAERPIYIFGKYRGRAQGNIKITGSLSEATFTRTMGLKAHQADTSHHALRHLWAREKIRWNQDFNQLAANPSRVEEITHLGLKYHLLTDYTSFVAIDEREIVNPEGEATVVRQPLPLPAGVSNYAVGFDMGVEGISQAFARAPKTGIKVTVPEKLDVNRQRLLECLILSVMSKWEEDVLKLLVGKRIEVVSDRLNNYFIVNIDDKEVSETLRGRIQSIFAQLPWDFAGSATIYIHDVESRSVVNSDCNY